MQREITFVPPAALMSRLTKRQWQQRYLLGYLWYLAIPLLTLLMALGSGEMSLAGRGGWVLGMLLGIVLTVVFLLVFSYRQTLQTLDRATRRWKGVEVSYSFDEEGFWAKSALSSSWRSWKMVQEVQLTPEALLLWSEQRFIALPTDQLTDELRQFILEKVTQAGAKVRR